MLDNYDGKIIVEIVNDDLDMVNSKKIIETIINKKQKNILRAITPIFIVQKQMLLG